MQTENRRWGMNAVSSAQPVAVLVCRRFGHNAVGTWKVHAPREDKNHFRNKTCKLVSVTLKTAEKKRMRVT